MFSFLKIFDLKPVSEEQKQIVKRESVSFNCTSDIDCFPPGISGNPPSTLISCDNEECLCRECFQRNASSGRCQQDSCEDYYFDSTQRDCVDDRPSQLTAFLLSLFLSSTGAANFYIGQNGLGESLECSTVTVFH